MIKKVMKTVLCACVLITALLFATEEIEPGITWIKYSDGTEFVGKSIGTTASKDTLNSAVYGIFSIQEASEYHSVRIVIDSVSGVFSILVELHEGYDGTNWEFKTTLGTLEITDARLDTILEVNLYPCPFHYLMFRETDASTADSADIDTVMWFNPHK